ncbi:MAG: GHKL domain-containing protein [Xanthobacteraceae bacterium]|nr:GHKL domain-containing protein [Xanthobacteraceae bacterium]
MIRPETVHSRIAPIAAATAAITIFVVDTVTDLEIAVAVFFVAVVLMSLRFCSRRGVLFVSAGCIVLTVASFLLTPTGSVSLGLINHAISIGAILVTTYLGLQIKSAEAAVLEARAQLEHVARLTALGELTATIAHEVNQPLTGVVTSGNACLRWLGGQAPNLEKAKQALARIINDANRASEVIARVRSLAKSAPPEKQPIDVNELVLEIISLLGSEFEQHRIVLQTRLADDLLPVFADRIQLQQVTLNILMNAIEAMDGVGVDTRKLLVATERNEPDSVVVSVQDSGIGLDLKNLPRVFDAFQSTKRDGMGIGLAISRSIVEAHGGHIWAESNVPRGAIFRFKLPIDGNRRW